MRDWRSELRAVIGHLDFEPGREESLIEELAQHLSEKYNEMLADDVPEPEAYRALMNDLQSGQLARELSETFRPQDSSFGAGSKSNARFFSGMGRDFRIVMRHLRLSPGFALTAILSLALGIGANTAIFELINSVLLRSLPVPDPQQLADISLLHQGRVGSSVSRQHEMSSAIWEQLKLRQRVFSAVAAWSTERFNLGHGDEAHYASGLWVSGSFFQTLGIRPLSGCHW